MRIQDNRCSKSSLPKATYKKSRTLALGPEENPIYYYHLTSIAIDMSQKMLSEYQLGRDWTKLPKNKTDVKTKIVERLVALRKVVNDEFVLDQNFILLMLHNVWGSINHSYVIH